MTLIPSATPTEERISRLVRDAVARHRQGDAAGAEAGYRQALDLDPDHGDALHLLGLIQLHRGAVDEAAGLIRRAVAAHPQAALYHNSLGLVLLDQGGVAGAANCFQQALALKPDYVEAWINLGRSYGRVGQREPAQACFQRALALAPESAAAHVELGRLLGSAGNLAGAVKYLEQALVLDPDSLSCRHDLAGLYHDLGRLAEAETCYRQVIQRRPHAAEAHNNLGTVLHDLGRTGEAETCYRQALALDPGSAEAHNNLGNLLQDTGQMAAAADHYRRAIAIDPDFAQAHNNLGMAFQETGQAASALVHYRQALSLKPDYAEACAHLVHMLQRACDWGGLPEAEKHLDALTQRALATGGPVAEQPFVSLVRGVGPARQHAIAASWARRAARLAAGARIPFAHDRHAPKDGPLTIGYLSANFRNHPMAHLMASLFEFHDRSRFRVHGYAFGQDDASEVRRRIAAGCDRFVNIDALGYAEAARRIYDDGVDILVDLMGHTKGNRMAICALRPAPVQVRYLGLAGTTGADYFDYLICDAVVVPETLAGHYSEKPIHMPHCYQVNDHGQPIDDRVWTRPEAGLPGQGTVFCCFNHAYKIDPVIFDAWMEILTRVPEGVLWLLSTTDLAESNLRARAESRGIGPGRLVFAPKLPKPQHLARLGLADLALDTRLVSGAATTSDALWAGVPVVTLMGDQFAANMSASILSAMGLGELVTSGIGAFIALAAGLAENPRKLARVRETLARNRTAGPLFDTRRFAGNLEDGYRQIWDRYRCRKAPVPVRIVEGKTR